MTLKDFLETKWTQVSGMGGGNLFIELENEDASKHVWLSVKGLISAIEKNYSQLSNEDIAMIFNLE